MQSESSSIEPDASVSGLDGRWIAVQVLVGLERRVTESLRQRDYETYLPVYSPSGPWSDDCRKATVLLPGYTFCRFISAPRHKIIEVSGVKRLVGYGKMPTPISQGEMDTIHRIADSGYRCESRRLAEVGQLVTVSVGPLKGLTGIIIRASKGSRLVVSLPLLQRSVAVDIDGTDLSTVIVKTQSPGGSQDLI
jgi:transcription antitermination factor NusG